VFSGSPVLIASIGSTEDDSSRAAHLQPPFFVHVVVVTVFVQVVVTVFVMVVVTVFVVVAVTVFVMVV